MTASLILIYGIGAITVLAAGATATVAALRRNLRVPSIVSYALIAGSVYLLVAQLLKLYAHKDYVDFTVSLQVISSIAQGRGPISTLQEGMMPGTGNWLSAHFTPLVVYAFAVPFRVVPRPETLLVGQFLVLSSTAAILYAYARRRLESHEHALAVAAVLMLYPTYQYIQLYEFEMLRFAMPLLLLAFLALETGRLRLYWIAVALALLVREDVAITVFLLGLYAVIRMPEHRRTGMATAGLAAAYFIVVVFVVMPHLRTGGAPYVAAYWFSQFGGSLSRIALGILTRPGLVLHAVLNPIKLANVAMYGLPLAFLPLLEWPVLLIGAGNVGLDMLSGSVTHTSYLLYYQAPALAFVFVALVRGVGRLGATLDARFGHGARTIGIGAVTVGLLASALVANCWFGPSPLSLQFWLKGYRVAPFRTLNFHYSQYAVTLHDRLTGAALSHVPSDGTVSAEQALLPSLYDRPKLKVFPDISGVDYVAVDKKNPLKTGIATVPGSWEGLREHPQYYYNWMEKDPAQWRVVFSQDGYFIYRHIPLRAGARWSRAAAADKTAVEERTRR